MTITEIDKKIRTLIYKLGSTKDKSTLLEELEYWKTRRETVMKPKTYNKMLKALGE